MKLFKWYVYGSTPILPYIQTSKGSNFFFRMSDSWNWIRLRSDEYETPLRWLMKDSAFFKAHGHDPGIIKLIFNLKPEAFKI